jgi:Na+-transporting methylmalonyl-CoA/oxaloacetate decarboxylase gamma subunit
LERFVVLFYSILILVNHAITKPVISRYPVNWKHESTVVLNWKSDETIFKITERDKAKLIPITHMTAHFPGLVHVLQLKSGGVMLVLYTQSPFLDKRCGDASHRKHESTVVLNWKSDEMNFPLNLTVNVDLYYPKVGDLLELFFAVLLLLIQNVPKSIFKITERDKAKSIPITHMTVHFPGLVLVLQLKSGGVKLVLCSQPPFLVKRCGHVSHINTCTPSPESERSCVLLVSILPCLFL